MNAKPNEPNQTISLEILFNSSPQSFLISDEMFEAFKEGEDPRDYVFFASIFFKPVEGKLGKLISTYYETETPWCIPVTFEVGPIAGTFAILFDYSELPKLKTLEKIHVEFQEQEKEE